MVRTVLAILAFVGCAVAQSPPLASISLGESRTAAHAALKSQATYEREEEGQEVWKANSGPIQHLIVGYDAEGEVRFVTALGNDIPCDALGSSPKIAGHAPDITLQRYEGSYLVIAHGSAREHLSSCSLKNPKARRSDPDEQRK